MAVRLENAEVHHVDFGRDAAGRDVVVPFPLVHRYEQTVAQVTGHDPEETGDFRSRVTYGYAPHPVIRIANVVASTASALRRLDLDRDGSLWLMCHRHRSAGESAAYAHGVLMNRDPSDGLPPAAIEYVTPHGHYTISARRPPAGAPAGLILYAASHDGPSGPVIMTTAIDSNGEPASPEAYLFPYVPLPGARAQPRMDR
jgi:hypothetical protein